MLNFEEAIRKIRNRTRQEWRVTVVVRVSTVLTTGGNAKTVCAVCSCHAYRDQIKTLFAALKTPFI